MKGFIFSIILISLVPSCRAQEIVVNVIPRPTPTPSPAPAPKPIVISYPTIEVKSINPKYPGKDLFQRILSKTLSPFTGDGRVTDAHETTHMIHAEIRNANQRRLKGRPAAFFILPDKAYVAKQPDFSLSKIRDFVPESVRYSRYNTYFLQSAKAWEDYPLYIYDEWYAYIAGASVAVEDAKNNISLGDRIKLVMPVLEFSIFAIATYDAALKYDPEYANNPEFILFLKDSLKRSEALFNEGRKIFPHPQQDELLNKFRNSEDCARLRELSKNLFDKAFLGTSTN